jgi:ribose transport system permease protein
MLAKFKKSAFYREYGPQISAIAALFVLALLLTLLSDRFLTATNLLSVLNQIAYLSIMAIGITGVIMTGCFDLSVSATLALAVTLAGELTVKRGWPDWSFVPFVLAVGLVCGFLAATGITSLDLPAFVVTMALMNIYRGLASIATDGYSAQGMPELVKFIGSGKVFRVPFAIILMLFLYAVEWFILSKTPLGLKMYAVGGNPVAAELSGIRVKSIRYYAYMQNGILAGISGLVLAGRMNSTNSTLATGVEMDAIAAVVIGGTSLAGGIGNIWGTLIGSIVMGVLRNGLNLLQVSAFWQQVAIGIIVFLSCAIDAVRQKQSKSSIG